MIYAEAAPHSAEPKLKSALVRLPFGCQWEQARCAGACQKIPRQEMITVYYNIHDTLLKYNKMLTASISSLHRRHLPRRRHNPLPRYILLRRNYRQQIPRLPCLPWRVTLLPLPVQLSPLLRQPISRSLGTAIDRSHPCTADIGGGGLRGISWLPAPSRPRYREGVKMGWTPCDYWPSDVSLSQGLPRGVARIADEKALTDIQLPIAARCVSLFLWWSRGLFDEGRYR